jgi:hypothetical protein
VREVEVPEDEKYERDLVGNWGRYRWSLPTKGTRAIVSVESLVGSEASIMIESATGDRVGEEDERSESGMCEMGQPKRTCKNKTKNQKKEKKNTREISIKSLFGSEQRTRHLYRRGVGLGVRAAALTASGENRQCPPPQKSYVVCVHVVWVLGCRSRESYPMAQRCVAAVCVVSSSCNYDSPRVSRGGW